MKRIDKQINETEIKSLSSEQRSDMQNIQAIKTSLSHENNKLGNVKTYSELCKSLEELMN